MSHVTRIPIILMDRMQHMNKLINPLMDVLLPEMNVAKNFFIMEGQAFTI